jgi:prepilin-type N-terminal cleavage/methylation domain-containing protein
MFHRLVGWAGFICPSKNDGQTKQPFAHPTQKSVGVIGRISSGASAESGKGVDALRLSPPPIGSGKQPGAHCARRFIPQAGFTLLELLLVVAILSSLALAATTFVENEDDQQRFEETRRRLENLRRAVVGYPNLSAGGEALVGGFVADMGRLPRNLNELFAGGYCSNAAYTSQASCVAAAGAWTADTPFGVAGVCSDSTKTTKVACDGTNSAIWVELAGGWRGPYLHALPESGGMAYRDGWGNGGVAPGADFGWTVAVTDIDGGTPPDDFDDTLMVRSLASDGAPGGSKYAADYPVSGTVLVERRDHNIDLTGGIRVRLTNPGNGTGCALPLDGSTGCTPASTPSVCLRIYYSNNGAITSVASDAVPLTSGLVPDGAAREVTFSFPSSGRQWVPWGARAVALFKHTGSCDSAAYPSAAAGTARTLTLPPRTSVPVIEWRME